MSGLVAADGSADVASGLTQEVITSVVTGCKGVVTGASSGITAIVPIGMEFLALTLGIRIMIRFFLSLVH